MRRPTLTRILAVPPLAVLLSGCLVGPNYKRAQVNAPPTFRGAEGAAQQASYADVPWWDVFKDDTLKGLIQTALKNNYDLNVAITRVEQARQIAAEARAQYFPFLDYTTTLSGGKTQFLGGPAPSGRGIQGTFYAAVSAAWEPDLWGKVRRTNEAARAQYLATEEARRGVMLTLVSEVSQAYLQLLGLQLQLEIAKESTESFGESLKLFTERLQGGVANKLQTSYAAADQATSAASIPNLELQITLTENQISVLLGQNPGLIATKIKLLEEIIPPEVPAGLPSALLERRPDVLSAEQQVRAANAQIGVATAAFFPQLSLTTFFGHATTSLSLFTSGQANAWSAAGNLAGPIFTGGLLKAQKRQAIAAWEQAKLQYQQAALSAFQDVANALVSRVKYDAVRVEQAKAVQDYQDALYIARQRYLNGFSSYYEILQVQQLLYPAQKELAVTELNRRLVIVQLYTALGGGWNLTDVQWNTPPASVQSPSQHP